MIKIIHTADWHLGHSFFGHDRRAEHELFLAGLQRTVSDRGADLLLIAGDIFDTPNPSADSQRLYYSFLRDVTAANPALTVVVIAGNHDSGSRLEAPHPLLESFNIITRGTVKRTADGTPDYRRHIVPVTREGHTIAYVLAVPYLRNGDYPDTDSYGEGVRLFYHNLFDTLGATSLPVIAMGHMQTSGARLSEDDRSERTVIGGLECVPTDLFPPTVSYVALGHMHRSQQALGRADIRFSGSPLAMSFAEKGSVKSLCYVELAEEGERLSRHNEPHERVVTDSESIYIELTDTEHTAELVRISTDSDGVEDMLSQLRHFPEGTPDATSPFLEVRVSVTAPEPSLRYRIEEALKGRKVRLARIEAIEPHPTEGPTATLSDLRKVNPMGLALEIFEKRYGTAMPRQMQTLLSRVIDLAQQEQ